MLVPHALGDTLHGRTVGARSGKLLRARCPPRSQRSFDVLVEVQVVWRMPHLREDLGRLGPVLRRVRGDVQQDVTEEVRLGDASQCSVVDDVAECFLLNRVDQRERGSPLGFPQLSYGLEPTGLWLGEEAPRGTPAATLYPEPLRAYSMKKRGPERTVGHPGVGPELLWPKPGCRDENAVKRPVVVFEERSDDGYAVHATVEDQERGAT